MFYRGRSPKSPKNMRIWVILKNYDIASNVWIFTPKMGKMHFWKSENLLFLNAHGTDAIYVKNGYLDESNELWIKVKLDQFSGF